MTGQHRGNPLMRRLPRRRSRRPRANTWTIPVFCRIKAIDYHDTTGRDH